MSNLGPCNTNSPDSGDLRLFFLKSIWLQNGICSLAGNFTFFDFAGNSGQGVLLQERSSIGERTNSQIRRKSSDQEKRNEDDVQECLPYNEVTETEKEDHFRVS